jgi:hypothetical protein
MDALEFEAALGNGEDAAAVWVAGWLADGRAVDSRFVADELLAADIWVQMPYAPEPDRSGLRALLAAARHLNAGRWNA